MKKNLLGTFLILLLSFGSISVFAQVEQVTGLTVSDPAAMVATIDQYIASGETKAQSVTFLTHLHDGVDPTTHTIVAIYDKLETLESAMEARANSAAWATLLRSTASISKANSSLLAIQRRTLGQERMGGGRLSRCGDGECRQ